ncbi:hypothetical protein AAH559_005613, partial [Salmonella enterica]
MLELSGNSTLTGRDLIMRTTLEGGNATGIPVYLNNATLNATHDITLSGVAHPVTTNTTADDGTVTTNTTMPTPVAIELRGAGNVLTAGGNITIENPASGNSNGVYLNGNASGKAQLTAGGTITLNGSSAGNGAGVLVNNSILNASQAVITGSSSTGKGFSLTNTTLAGGLADLVNVTFSSAGSGAGVTNLLDDSVVTSSNRDTMLDKSIENMTSIDMGGTAIFDDSAKDNKGWTHNYTHADNPNGGWIFNNTTVTAGGDVMLGGVGFTNSTVNVSSGNLSIDNNSAALLTGTTITVGDGAVNVHAGAGNIDLSKGSISAKGDITLQTDNGSISISGTNATETASITSDSGTVSINSGAGNINLTNGNVSTSGDIGLSALRGRVSVDGSNITSDGGNISVTGNVAGLGRNDDGVLLNNTYLQAKAGKIKVKGTTDGFSGFYNSSYGGVGLKGGVTFNSTLNTIDGEHINGSLKHSYAGVVFYAGDFNFINDTVINATADSYAGLLFDVGYSTVKLNFHNGNNSIIADNKYGGGQEGYTGGVGIVPWQGRPQSVVLNMDQANLNITASAITADGIMAYHPAGNVDNFDNSHKAGYVFSGSGDVNIKGISDSKDGVSLHVLDNTGLTGKFTVSGESNSGTGVIVPRYANVNVINATITGSSHSGAGIQINAADSHTQRVNLSGNTLIGTSDTSNGIYINGNNVTITHGTLNGTTTSGNGAGVVITGGTNYTIDGANVTGQSANGAGVSVTGNLAVNNDATIIGVSTGSGDGVNVNGTLLS